MWHHDFCGFNFMGLGGFMGLIGLILLIVIIYFLIRVFSSPNTSNPSTTKDNALKILNERYARGEIDRETYEKMKHDIENG